MTEDHDETEPSTSEHVDSGPPPVRRDQRGRLLPGASLNPKGRPKGAGALPPFPKLLQRVADQQGIAVEDALGALIDVAVRKAAEGDMHALRLILDRIPDESRASLLGFEDGEDVGPPMPTGQALVDYYRECAAYSRDFAEGEGGRVANNGDEWRAWNGRRAVMFEHLAAATEILNEDREPGETPDSEPEHRTGPES